MLQMYLKWIHEIAVGLEYFHSKELVHIDIAMRNILLDKNKVAMVSDFGLSRRIEPDVIFFK